MSAVAPMRPTTVVFDLGGVLIDWDPRYLYRQLFDDPDEMESFLAEVTTAEWNAHQDAGRPWAEAGSSTTSQSTSASSPSLLCSSTTLRRMSTQPRRWDFKR